MVKSIKVSDDVYRFLQNQARPFEDAPDDVLRRLLPLGDVDVESQRTRGRRRNSEVSPSEEGTTATSRSSALSVARMRAEAITRIEHVIGGSLRPVLTGAHRAALISQGARGQRLVTPRGQVIYLRTRSYSAERPPFFTVQPRTFDDANWYIFVCGGRGHIVAPAAELHQLAPGLHRDAGGDFKPTFLIDHERCALYAFGATRDVSRWRDAYDAIGTDERRSPPKSDRGLVLPPVGVDPTYTDPVARLAVDCGTCGTAVIGYERGSADFRALMKAIKAHEDEYHPPYERDLLIPSLQHAVDRFNGGELVPQVVGRYRIQMFRAPGRSTTRDAD